MLWTAEDVASHTKHTLTLKSKVAAARPDEEPAADAEKAEAKVEEPAATAKDEAKEEDTQESASATKEDAKAEEPAASAKEVENKKSAVANKETKEGDEKPVVAEEDVDAEKGDAAEGDIPKEVRFIVLLGFRLTSTVAMKNAEISSNTKVSNIWKFCSHIKESFTS